ncbi:MAG: hypothetical protein P4L45_13050 [Ignavibacteriaceae bacterium]|nr:hypothetical protein [Ignavibacteriaceae bacterium]
MKDENKDKHENHITLTIITVDGNFTNDFNIHNTLKVVVEKTIEALGLLYELAQYGLYRNGSTFALDINLKISEAGIVDCDELEFRKINAGGGEGSAI